MGKEKAFKNKLLLVIVAGVTVSLVFASRFNIKLAFAKGGRNGECEDAQIVSVENGNENLKSYTASGRVVEGVCIKSGSNMFSDGHSGSLGNGEYEDGCYLVRGVGTGSVSVERKKEGKYCQGLSHLDIYTRDYGQDAEPTPTPTPRPEVKDGKVAICHATGSQSNPFVKIVVSANAVSGGHGHEGHEKDIYLDNHDDQCPGTEVGEGCQQDCDEEEEKDNPVGGAGQGEDGSSDSNNSEGSNAASADNGEVLGASTTALADTGASGFIYIAGLGFVAYGLGLWAWYRRLFI